MTNKIITFDQNEDEPFTHEVSERGARDCGGYGKGEGQLHPWRLYCPV